jgi:hypothetical protein
MNAKRPDTSRGSRRARRALATAVLLLAGAAFPARGEEKWTMQGLFDAEAWQTDDGSRLLSRNEGYATGGGRLRLWAAGDFAPWLQGFARGAVADGDTSYGGGDGTVQSDLELAFLRFTAPERTRVVVEAGRLQTPVGDFSGRYLSTQNPLIGVPDNYGVDYPLGLKVRGHAGRFDYTAAAVDKPMVVKNYLPETGDHFRPALGGGYTPITGLRFGAFVTQGPYLGDSVESALPAGTSTADYDQKVEGFETQFSRGYFELHAEIAWSRYDVPTYTSPVRGRVFYLEPKYTFTPRFFAALRVEQNEYAYVAVFPGGFWLGTPVTFADAEVGVGWRLTPELLLKASYRRDRWDVDESLKDILPDGYAVAAQLSYTFDVRGWIEHPR